MRTEIVLKVSESKRLIAKGIVELQQIKKALQQGIVSVAKGTTNSYICEELLKQKIEKTQYVTGHSVPEKSDVSSKIGTKVADLVLKNGERMEGISAVDAVAKEMKAGDVFLKGANALNYEKKVAGILVGHQTGGTIGGTYGSIIARHIELIIPVGLEKCVGFDIIETSKKLNAEKDLLKSNSGLFPVTTGTIFTEIEAIKTLFGLESLHIGSGGIGKAEGAVRLSVFGSREGLEKARKYLDDNVLGEPEFVS